jgi:Phage Mu protein F like protein
VPVSHPAYHAAFLATLDRFEGQLQGKIVKDKAVFIKAASAEYANSGAANFFHLVDAHQNAIFDTLSKHYRKVIPAFGSLSLHQVKSRQFKDDEEDSLFSDLADTWVHTEGLKRSKLIADTTEADVLAAISDGLDNGDGTGAIASAIEDVTELSDFRSEMIARTETHAAANYASVETVRNAEKKLDVTMLKTWLPTLDDRTRPAHAEMDGSEAISMDEPFIVDGEEMDRPGDPAGSAENTINCRCTLGFEEAKQ